MPISIWNLNAKEIYVGNQKIKEIYVGTEKVYGGKVVEYYFRSQEDIKRALRDQITSVEERYVDLYNNTMRTQQRRFALPIGIENPKIVEIKGTIQNSEFGRLPWAQVGVWNYDGNRVEIYFQNGIDTRYRNLKIYGNSRDISLIEYGNTIINFTLTFTYIGFKYIWTTKMLQYSVKATGDMYNNFSTKPFTLEYIRQFDQFSPCFVFYLEDYAEIQIEYFKAQ